MVLVDSTVTLQVISILNLAWAVTTSTTATATTTNSFADFAVPESKRLIIPHLHSVPIDNMDYHMMHRHMVWLKIRKTKTK
jgi:hypothetical protein